MKPPAGAFTPYQPKQYKTGGVEITTKLTSPCLLPVRVPPPTHCLPFHLSSFLPFPVCTAPISCGPERTADTCAVPATSASPKASPEAAGPQILLSFNLMLLGVLQTLG